MKVHLFIVADPYTTQGWSVVAVDATDKWSLEHNLEREDAFLYRELDISDPTTEDLVKIGLARADEMKEEIIKNTVRDTQRVKEFESKFLSLEAPAMETDELS